MSEQLRRRLRATTCQNNVRATATALCDDNQTQLSSRKFWTTTRTMIPCFLATLSIYCFYSLVLAWRTRNLIQKSCRERTTSKRQSFNCKKFNGFDMGKHRAANTYEPNAVKGTEGRQRKPSGLRPMIMPFVFDHPALLDLRWFYSCSHGFDITYSICHFQSSTIIVALGIGYVTFLLYCIECAIMFLSTCRGFYGTYIAGFTIKKVKRCDPSTGYQCTASASLSTCHALRYVPFYSFSLAPL